MQLRNDTPLSARLYRGALHDSVNGAWVVARGCFRRTREGLHLEGDPWPIFDAPMATAFGTLPADIEPMRAGVSVFALGTVRCDAPSTTAMCSLQVGEQVQQLRVFGRRQWERRDAVWRPGQAEPFESLPLSWAYCPGGTTRHEDKEVEHPTNPAGMGFVLDEALLPTVEVPRIEDVREVIDTWRPLPAPRCWAPVADTRSMYIPGVVETATQEGRIDLVALQRGIAALPQYDAPPDTQFDMIPGGALVDAQLGDHGLRVRAPIHNLAMTLRVGRETYQQSLRLSSVWLLVDLGLTVFTWRARMAYPIRAGELRVAQLGGVIGGVR